MPIVSKTSEATARGPLRPKATAVKRHAFFVAANRPTGEVEFQILCEHIQHENGITVFVDHLPGGFSVDCGCKGRIGNNTVHKFGERGLETVEGKFSHDTCQSDGVRNFSFPLFVLKLKELTELRKMNFGPAPDFGQGGNIGKEPEEDNGQSSMKRVRDTLFGAGIGHFFETINEDFERIGMTFDTSVRVNERRKPFASDPITKEKQTRFKKTCYRSGG
jgi:hypothetical protein